MDKSLFDKIINVLQQDYRENGQTTTKRAEELFEKTLKLADSGQIFKLLQYVENIDRNKAIGRLCSLGEPEYIYNAMNFDWLTDLQLSILVNGLAATKDACAISTALLRIYILNEEQKEFLGNVLAKTKRNFYIRKVMLNRKQIKYSDELNTRLLRRLLTLKDEFSVKIIVRKTKLSSKELSIVAERVSKWDDAKIICEILEEGQDQFSDRDKSKLVAGIVSKEDAQVMARTIECFKAFSDNPNDIAHRKVLIISLEKTGDKEIIGKTLSSGILTREEKDMLKPNFKTANEIAMDNIFKELNKELSK